MQYDSRELWLLVESARILLTSAVLKEVSGDDAPTQALCRATQNHLIGYEIREDLTGSGVVVPTDGNTVFNTESRSTIPCTRAARYSPR